MKGFRPSLTALLLAAVGLSGCMSVQYRNAVDRGAAPWYLVKVTSPDAQLIGSEIKVYKLTKKVDSPEGKKEGLKEDVHWGEGHGDATVLGHGGINSMIQIEGKGGDFSDCDYSTNAAYSDEKKFGYVAQAYKENPCEMKEFESPFFSARIETEDHKWITVDYNFERATAANLPIEPPAADKESK